jgi:hypothetical protein
MFDYHDIPRVSNSDLSRLKAQLAGKVFHISQRASHFGKTLHHFLETDQEAEDEGLSEAENKLARQLSGKVRSASQASAWMQNARREEILLFTDAQTSLECKARLDVFAADWEKRSFLVVDYKTTTARNYFEFINSCSLYDYDRQAAFYLDGVQRAMPELEEGKFLFVGIQKIEPYELFFFEPRTDSDFIHSGRRKYRYLLDRWKVFGGLLSRPEGNISLAAYAQASDYFKNIA